jgi:chitodextrinase
VTAQNDTIPPSVPTGLAASAITINSFTLTWTASTDNVGVTAYEVFRGTTSLGTVAAPATTLAVVGLAPNTAYAMKVRARDAAGRWSAQSIALTVKTLADTTPPAISSGFATSALTATGLTLTWSASTDNVAVTGYEVFRNGITAGTTTTLSRAFTGLAPTTAYSFTVRARDAAGNWSAQSPAFVISTPPDTTAPAVPIGLAASLVTTTGFTLKWTAATDNVRVTGYEVFRNGVSLGLTTATSRAFTALAPATTFSLTVRARDAAGNVSALSAPLSVSTLPDTAAPSVPASLTPTLVAISGFTFRWSAATDNVAVTAYEVFRDGVAQPLVAAPATSLAFTGLALNTPYTITVRARDAAGNFSALSVPRIVSTLADTTPPTVPAGLVASAATINSFTLSWNASTDNVGVTAYEVFRGTVSLGLVNSPALTLALTGLAPNTGYSMRVRARDAAGKWSAQSVALVVRTLPDTTDPAIPAAPVASAVTVTGLTLSWPAATDDVAVTGYEVFRNGVSLGTTPATTLTRAVTGLTPDTAYTFTVRARDAAANWSDPSAPLVVSTPPDTAAPTAPAGLTATVISVSSFTLNWTAATDNVSVTAYEISRDGTVVGTSTKPTRNISGLVPATSYTFTVRARDAAGNWSAPSVPLPVATLADTTPPAVPTALVASLVTGSSFTLRWTAPKDNVRTALYEVFRDGVSLGTTTATSRVLTGLFPETEYAMSVRAADAAGNWSAQSLPLPVTTTADFTAPSVPGTPVASAITVTGFTLTWTASTDGVGVTLYEVFQDNVSVGTTAARTLNLSGLTPNTTYALKVRASDAAGNWSAPSAVRSVKTLADSAAPTVPAALVASAITNTSVTLTWTASTDNVGVTAYEVFRGTVSQGTTDATTMVVNGLTPATAYTLRVRARDAAGRWSTQSVALVVTTTNDTTPPSVPDGLASTGLTLDALTVVWNASTDDLAVTAYEVYRDGVSVGTTAVPSFSFTGLVLNTSYAIRVRARDAAGNFSALSAPLTVTPARDTFAPSAPAAVAAANLTPTGFTVNWTAATDDVAVTSYEIFVNGVSVGLAPAGATSFNVTALPPGGPAYVVTIRARDAAGNWSTLSDPLTVTLNPVPFFTGFEVADGYTLGALHGQKGWSVDGSAAIVTAPAYRGTQAVAVAPLANLSLVTRTFANANPGVTFVDVFARPAAAADPGSGTFLETDSAAVALTGLAGTDTFGTIQFFNGNGTSGGEWQTVSSANLATTIAPALDSAGQVTAWQRLTLRTDYAAKRWDLFLNSRLIAADLGFLENTAASLTSLSLNGHATLATGFDDVFAGFENPLFTDADKDGLDDAWELANGLNPAVNDRNADLDGDGISNLQEYLNGTGANIPNTALDTDGDGLPDAWELQYLGTLAYGPTADPGAVGRTLLQSYQQTLSPWPAPVVAPGLRLWLRADLGVIKNSAGAISRWLDLAAGNHAFQDDDLNARPLAVAAPLGMNGRPVVRFDGVDDVLRLPDAMSGATAGELIVVTRLKDFSNPYSSLAHFGSGYANIYYQNGDVGNDFGTADQAAYPGPGLVVLTAPHLLDASVSNAGESILRFNGIEQVRVSGQTVAFRPDPLLGSDYYADFYNGDIAEVLVYDRVLTAVERDAVQTSLVTKYGITAAIPQPPPAPVLSAFVPTMTSVALSWTPTPAASGTTTILERQRGGGAFAEIASVATATTFTDSGLTAGATYTYRAKATNTAGASAYSALVTVTMPAAVAGVPSSGQRLWLRADVGVATDDTGAVTTWYDQSGQQKDATQLIPAARPALVPNAANGKPVVRFDGASRSLDIAPFMTGAPAGELLVIIKIPDFANRYDGPWALGGSDGALTELRDGIKTFTEDFGRTTRIPTGVPVTSPTDYIVYNISADATNWTLRLNGTQQFSANQSGVAFSAAPTLGRGAANANLLGDIAEIIAYDRVLTAAERTAAQTYLATKYSVSLQPKPVLSALAATSTSVVLSWAPAPFGGPSATSIERQSAGGPFAVIATLDNSVGYVDIGLTQGSTYNYRIRHTGSSSSTPLSGVVSVALVGNAASVSGAGLRLWLRADAGVQADAVNGVATWTDQSGRSKHAEQANPSARPKLVNNAANGQPVVRFDGSGSFLNVPAYMDGATGGDLFVVVKVPNFATRDDGLWMLGGADGTWSQFDGTARILTEDFGRTYRTALGAPVVPMTNYVVYNVSAQTDDWRVRLNGRTQSVEVTNTVQFGATARLGRNAYADFFLGDIAEVIAYDRVLAAPERGALNVYLSAKYNALVEFDTDGDGIPDAWEIAFGLNPNSNDADADADGDGTSNLLEYRYHRNPTKGVVPDSGNQVGLTVYTPSTP